MITARNPVMNSSGGIDMLVTLPWIGYEIPFSADQGDSNEYSADLFTRALKGDFGAVGAYQPAPSQKTIRDVSPRQIRMALTRASLRTQVEAAVAAGDQDLKDWWEFSTVFERDNPQVAVMITALGVSEAQADAVWELAYTL